MTGAETATEQLLLHPGAETKTTDADSESADVSDSEEEEDKKEEEETKTEQEVSREQHSEHMTGYRQICLYMDAVLTWQWLHRNGRSRWKVTSLNP